MPAVSMGSGGKVVFAFGNGAGQRLRYPVPAGARALGERFAAAGAGSPAAAAARTAVVALSGAARHGRIGFAAGASKLPGRVICVDGWSTFVIRNKPVTSGRWYWEVHQEDVLQRYAQIGIATASMAVTATQGVGDDGESYGWDMDRKTKWHAGSQGQYLAGEPWRDGDTLMLLLDLDAGTLTLGRNGQMGSTPAFTGIRGSSGWMPGVSMRKGGKVLFAFGNGAGGALRFSVPSGARPLGEWFA